MALLDAADPDLVDEIARDLLGFAHPEDRIIAVRRAERPMAAPSAAGPSN
jgi:hypothetical protein